MTPHGQSIAILTQETLEGLRLHHFREVFDKFVAENDVIGKSHH